jgi:hypothetical protein
MTDSLSGDVSVPVAGKLPKKAVAGGLLVVAVLIVVYYVRKKSSSTSSAAAAAATSTDQYPPDGTSGNPDDPYSTDPATGQTYGDESVGSGGTYGAYGAATAETDTYPWDGTTGNEDDPYSLDPATGETFGDEGLATGGTNANPNGGPPFANNSDWEVWVTSQLEETDTSINADDLTQALGLYLNGQPVTPAQKVLIFDATGAGGDPPVAGPNNYPPNVQTNGGDTATAKVPNCAGQTAGTAHDLIVAAGLVPVDPNANVSGEPSKKVASTDPPAGTSVASGSQVTIITSTSTTSPATVTVPALSKGETAGSMHDALEAAGLKPAAAAGQQPGWVVKSISPASGTKVPKGTKVIINATGK